jgi:hypothetical protein
MVREIRVSGDGAPDDGGVRTCLPFREIDLILEVACQIKIVSHAGDRRIVITIAAKSP